MMMIYKMSRGSDEGREISFPCGNRAAESRHHQT